jgi:hypothetical protein
MKRFILALIMAFALSFSVYAQRVVMPYAKVQFFDRNGKPLAGGKLYTYVAGTTTPKTTYSSASGAANLNPVILDSAGRAQVWLDATTSYKFVLKDRNDVEQWTVDSVTDYGGQYAAGTTELSGDVTGAYDSNVVTKIQGIAISETDPSEGEALIYTSGAWTPGSATSALAMTVSTLEVDSGDGTIATDASDGNLFRVTLTTDCPCTLSTPTNPTNGQEATWEIIQAATADETLAYSAVFAFGTDVEEPTITVTASKRDFITAIYNSTTSKWYVVRVAQGY